MGVTRTVLEHGYGDQPKEGDEITVEYTGFLYDEARQCRGKIFAQNGDFKARIGIGNVIKGWDEGIMEMRLGEKSKLIISSDYAYGPKSILGYIPPNSALKFEVRLHGINRVITDAASKDGVLA